MLEPKLSTPLADYPPIGGIDWPVHIFEQAFAAKFVLRMALSDLSRLDGALDFPLPREPLSAAFVDQAGAMRLGPDEWLLVIAPERAQAVCDAIESALRGRHMALVDLSHALTEIAVEGPGGRELLAAGCPLDLDPTIVAPGFASRTLLGKAEVVLAIRAQNAISLFVARSFAGYLMAFLAEAARSLRAGG